MNKHWLISFGLIILFLFLTPITFAGLFGGDDVFIIKKDSNYFFGTLVTGKWCDFNGQKINCTQNTPSGGSGTDTNWQSSWSMFDANMKNYYMLIGNYMTKVMIDGNNYMTKTQTDGNYVARNTWTTIDNYPTGCSAGQYVSTIGDTLTCGTPPGNNTEIQFNDDGNFGADANFTYSKATKKLAVPDLNVEGIYTTILPPTDGSYSLTYVPIKPPTGLIVTLRVTLNLPSIFTATESEGTGYLGASTLGYQAYSYKTISGTKTYTALYKGANGESEFTIENDESSVDLYLEADGSEEGIRILRNLDSGGFVDYMDITGGSPYSITDDATGWTSGSTVTPNQAVGQFTYDSGDPRVFRIRIFAYSDIDDENTFSDAYFDFDESTSGLSNGNKYELDFNWGAVIGASGYIASYQNLNDVMYVQQTNDLFAYTDVGVWTYYEEAYPIISLVPFNRQVADGVERIYKIYHSSVFNYVTVYSENYLSISITDNDLGYQYLTETLSWVNAVPTYTSWVMRPSDDYIAVVLPAGTNTANLITGLNFQVSDVTTNKKLSNSVKINSKSFQLDDYLGTAKFWGDLQALNFHGVGATASNGGFAWGSNSVATGNYAIVLGTACSAPGNYTFVSGIASRATKVYGIAIGDTILVDSIGGVGIGRSNTIGEHAFGATAIGFANTFDILADYDWGGLLLGYGNFSSSALSVAIGSYNHIVAEYAYVFGQQIYNDVENSVMIGLNYPAITITGIGSTGGDVNIGYKGGANANVKNLTVNGWALADAFKVGDANIYWDGSNLHFGQKSGVAKFDRNVIAPAFVTETDVYDKNQGSALSKIQDASAYLNTGAGRDINHSAFTYSNVTYPISVFDKYITKKTEYQVRYCIQVTGRTSEKIYQDDKNFVEACLRKKNFFETRIKTEQVPIYKTEYKTGVDLVKEVSLIKQAEYELKVKTEVLELDNNVLKQRINVLEADNVLMKKELCLQFRYSWCK